MLPARDHMGAKTRATAVLTSDWDLRVGSQEVC
jgi:hypothetical protein